MDCLHGQPNEYILRILVPSDSVGAIIGKQGSTVKQIKQTTHAKIDVNKNESANNQERVIAIRGQQENCIEACREILRIMYDDAKTKNKTNEIILKVLAHNSFIGRIIGKGGNIINAIKKETDTNITVSSINELSSFNVERIISIKGEFDHQIRALDTIYGKLCMAYETDNARTWNYAAPYYHQQQFMQQFAQQAAMMAAVGTNVPSLLPAHYPQQTQSMVHPPTSNNPNGSSNKYIESPTNPNGFYQAPYYQPIYPTATPFFMSYPPSGPIIQPQSNPYVNGSFVHQQEQLQALQNAPVVNETVHLYVPSNFIGAIIGTKGLFIKSIIKNSNASVKINPLNPDEDPNKVTERQIIITGTPEAQWKSQYYIYDKIRQESCAGDEEVRLRAEILVPTTLIGRLVGKGGHNVRQLQQSTGAVIKLPEDSHQTSANEVSVKIIGAFQSSQFAQRRIQSIIQMSRDFTNHSNEDNNNIHNINTDEQLNELSKLNLNETSTIVNGSTNSDDAVVASSTLPNTDDSVTTFDDQKSSNE